jgi:lysophospholipase L1-like esterase
MADYPFTAASASATPLFYQQLGGAHSGKLQGWFAALGRRQTARANIALIGNSVTAGQGATSFPGCWAQLLPVQLRARFPTPGLATAGRGFLPPIIPPSNPTTFSPPYVAISGATAGQLEAGSLYGFGPNLETWNLNVGSGASLAYSLVGDSADILWAGATGNGTFSWKVDAGGTTNISTSTALNPAAVTHVSLGSAGAHTLTVAYVSGTPVYVTGVIEYDGDYTSGIQCHDLGFSGSTSGYWTVTGGATELAAALASLSPGLICIELGLNDNANGIAPAVTAANITSVIAAIRAALGATCPPFLLLAMYNAAQDGPTSAALWAQYVTALYGIAAADPLIDILDFSLRMPSTAAANTWSLYNADGIHPNNAGHQLIADILTDFLSPA